MGYYTEYTLKILVDPNKDLVGDDSTIERVLKYLEENEEMHECLEQDTHGSDVFITTESIKWYDHDEYMKAMSLAIQDVVFELTGKGEEDDDLWRKFYLNGKSHGGVAKISVEYAEFDPSELA